MMQCWKCGGQTVSGVCTLCGGRESDRKPAMTPAGKSLRYVYDKFGAKRTLTEDGLLVRCLVDVLPEETELRRVLTDAFAAGAGKEFYALLECHPTLTDAAFQGLVRALQAAGMPEKDVHTAMITLWDMAGCGVPGMSQPEPKPAPQPIPNRPMEQPKYQQQEPVERPKYPQKQKREAPAPRPVQTNVDMRWHDELCKVGWLAPLAGLGLLFFIDQYPFVDFMWDGTMQCRLLFTSLLLLWGFAMRKRLKGVMPSAYIHPSAYFVVVGLLDVIHVVDLYNNTEFYSLVEYYQMKATGYEDFAGLAWLFWIYCGVCVVLLALAVYTGNYYKDPQRRALFDQK